MKAALLVWGILWATTAFGVPRMGINFVGYQGDRPGETTRTVDEVNGDVKRLGADAMRQFVRADLVWRDVEPQNNVWTFENADSVLKDAPITPIVTLFSLQFASGTPPWDQGPGAFRPILGAHARDYVETVVKRYADHVQYWEIGNEMDRWRVSDSGDRNRAPGRRPPHNPPGGFTPVQQGKFVADVARVIRMHDPDAVILMPGMAGLSTYVLETWLPGFVEGAGLDAFDIVNYHFYGPLGAYSERRGRLQKVLMDAGIEDKPVWLTETGSSSSTSLSPTEAKENASEHQAADVFRRMVSAWGEGDTAVFWHAHMDSPNRPDNRFQGYGLRDASGKQKPAYGAYRLLSEHIAPFVQMEKVNGLKSGQHGFRMVLENGTHRWVFWGSGTVDAPNDPHAKGCTSVVPNEAGRHVWKGVPDQIVLSDIPVLLRN